MEIYTDMFQSMVDGLTNSFEFTMIKLTSKTASCLAIIVAFVALLCVYTASTSNVPNLFNKHLIHQIVRPIFRSASSTEKRNVTLAIGRRHKLSSKPEIVSASNRKPHFLQASESDANAANKADQNENEVIPQAESPNRSLTSMNGAVDSRKYSNDELDRLYGDGLLVYVKNFNETNSSKYTIQHFAGQEEC